MKRNWLIHDNTGSVEGGTGYYLVVLVQYGALLVGSWWYWVGKTWYCLVLSGTGLVSGFMPVYIEKSRDLFGWYYGEST